MITPASAGSGKATVSVEFTNSEIESAVRSGGVVTQGGRLHFVEYFCEGVLVLTFVFMAAGIACLMNHPEFPLGGLSLDPGLRLAMMAGLTGALILGLVHSTAGKRSGAHLNPAVTLAFLQAGKIRPVDAIFYVIFQFGGAALGFGIFSLFAGEYLSHPSIHFLAPQAGPTGPWVAFGVEFLAGLILMFFLLAGGNSKRFHRWTPLVAALLTSTFILLAMPLSGAGLNPAKTFGASLVGMLWSGLWIYLTAPVLAMQAAAFFYRAAGGKIHCAKLHHHNSQPCIFRCEFHDLESHPREVPKTRV